MDSAADRLPVSIAFDDIPGPDFADAVIVSIPESPDPVVESPVWWARQVFSVSSAPPWVTFLLGLRQLLVGLVGINRATEGVFDIAREEGNEALISTDDTHLDFRAAVGIYPDRRLLQVTTVVRLHGWRGRLYFVPVSVLHGPVTRSMVKRAVRNFANRGSAAKNPPT